MNLIPAPGRQFKTWSMWLLIAAGLFDMAVALTHALGDAQAISVQTLAIVNAVLVFAAGAVRFIQQQIALTTEQKADIVAAAAAQPLKPGEDNVAVHINAELTPSTPQERKSQ